MPCTDNGMPYDYTGPIQNRLDTATRVACAVLKALQDSGEAEDAECTQDFWERLLENGEISTWWAKHKKDDSAREAREKEEARAAALHKAALAKLTLEEREIIRRRGVV